MTVFAANRSTAPHRSDTSHKPLYLDLFQHNGEPRSKLAEEFLQTQLAAARQLAVDLPTSADGLAVWANRNVVAVGEQYRNYLAQRKAGGARHYFANKSQALFFLKMVAPTKLVDGAWLYGLLNYWQDMLIQPLIKTYLEELGEGDACKNHVAIYKKLLNAQGCEDWLGIDERYFQQGAIQLALAYNAEKFLPEIIGFNLGYEQLPLHLLITAYELAELGIDPYYFTLHITIDNLDSGHAKKAMQSVIELCAGQRYSADFYRRVVNGYQLNGLGEDTGSIIKSFNLDREVVALLTKKSDIGKYMHSDRCRIGGRTINDWLTQPHDIPKFLQVLEKSAWIRRHQNPIDSRFWQLIQGEQPQMFGVFTTYEQQVIYDWIAGDWLSEQKPKQFRAAVAAEHPAAVDSKDSECRSVTALSPLRGNYLGVSPSANKNAVMRQLIASMSPALHATPAGLNAARIYKDLLNS